MLIVFTLNFIEEFHEDTKCLTQNINLQFHFILDKIVAKEWVWNEDDWPVGSKFNTRSGYAMFEQPLLFSQIASHSSGSEQAICSTVQIKIDLSYNNLTIGLYWIEKIAKLYFWNFFTWEKYPADHSRPAEQKERQDLQVAC